MRSLSFAVLVTGCLAGAACRTGGPVPGPGASGASEGLQKADAAFRDMEAGESRARPLCVQAEAEDGAVSAPMKVFEAVEASGGRYVASHEGESGQVAFDVDIPVDGHYVIWTRVLGQDAGKDSFYVKLDDGQPHVYDAAEETWGRWHWRMVNARFGDYPLFMNPRIFRMSRGKHRIVFKGREAGACLDRIAVTYVRDFDPPR